MQPVQAPDLELLLNYTLPYIILLAIKEKRASLLQRMPQSACRERKNAQSVNDVDAGRKVRDKKMRMRITLAGEALEIMELIDPSL